ncbi:contact-dependent growth inhibition system immunity protein [Jatrophihabitans sp. YIM 134969]
MSSSEPGLPKLARAYFNQDYDLDGTPDEVVRRFVSDHPRSVVERTADQIKGLLAGDADEAELDRIWGEQYRSNFLPETVGMTYRQWFGHVLTILDA